jgi:ubiquinone/menaquinone biosynthesis C-methylase UbiE
MKTRGEELYIDMPSFAARLYDNLTSVRGVNKSFEEISIFVASAVQNGRLLDIGTGPGRLLAEINKQIPQIELFGLDISRSMLAVAEHNLQHIDRKDLRLGNITGTDYQDDFFDCIVSSGSFYNWNNPVEGLDEIFRILKPGKSAFIFETSRDYDKKLLNSRLKENFRGYGFLRKAVTKYFLRRQLRMTYSLPEFDQVLKQSMFSGSYMIYRIVLGNLPVYVRLELKKG